jgi:phosphatidylinositol alpha-1,6-mannosyltransferase
MKILLLSSTNDVLNGYGNLTHELCLFLQNRMEFKLLLPRTEKHYDYATYDIDYILPEFIFKLKTPKVWDYFRFDYKAEGFELIHSLSEFPYALLGARLSRRYEIPLIITTQGTYAVRPLFLFPEKQFLSRAYAQAACITAPSKFTRDAVARYSGTTSPIHIIHNGVNFSRFDRVLDTSTERQKFGGKKILLTVGGLKSRKGQDVVLRALGQVKKFRNDFHYLIIGSGGEAYRNKLASLVEEFGLLENVTFLGNMSGDELVRYFHLCDIYIHTARRVDWNFEGFGIVYLEASACKKSIIAADSGGVADAVVDGKTGLLVPENDVEGTVAAVVKLLDSAELRKTLGQNGYEYAREHDWPKIGSKFIDLYKTTI